MKKVNYIKYGLTALLMAFAMTLCYSCSSDDEDAPIEEPIPPSNGDAYVEFAIDSVSTEENEFSECGGYDKAW